MSSELPLLLGGPSGVGKTFFCEHLKERGWIYLEADQHPKDGINELGLRVEWDDFWVRCQPGRLASALNDLKGMHRGVVLSLPSGAILPPELLSLSQLWFRMRFLWGDPRWCLAAFLERERRTGRNYDAGHWDQNNQSVFAKLSGSAYHRCLVDVFSASGNRLSCDEIEAKLS